MVDFSVCEIGYCLSRKYWNKGVMSEVLDAYFDNKWEDLTESICLYEYLNGYELSENGIRDYKKMIKEKLVGALKNPLEGFKLFYPK